MGRNNHLTHQDGIQKGKLPLASEQLEELSCH